MKCKMVIDTNVLVSYLLSTKKRTAVREVMDSVLSGEVAVVVSEAIFKEYKDVLSREKFGFSAEVVKVVLDFLRQNSITVETYDTGVELTDQDDLPFFEAYIAEKGPETFLVTGNTKHFPEWPYIVTPRQMVDVLKRR